MDPKRIDDVLAAVLSDLKSITDMANSTLEDVRAIRLLMEKQNQPPSLAGWMAPSDRSPPPNTSHPAIEEVRSSALIDICKRLEHCYRDWGAKKPFIDFRATQALVEEIFMSRGLKYLTNYVRFCENKWNREGRWAIGRPERMREQYQYFASENDFNG